MFARTLTRLVDGQAAWAAPLGKLLQRVTNALLDPVRPLRDFLNGTWLGHSLHASLTDIPIGGMTLVIVLDLVGPSPAADVALTITILAMLAAAVAGATDHADTVGRERVVTTVHATLMTAALVLLVIALILRLGGGPERGVPIAIGIVGYLVMLAGAWVGGEAVYGLGSAVDRHAWLETDPKAWHRLEVGEMPPGQPIKASAGDMPLVVVREGDTIRALHETCAHAGGPLSEGAVVDGAIQCPWHGSRFDLATGDMRQGPTTHAQPAFEVRLSEEGGYEVRSVS